MAKLAPRPDAEWEILSNATRLQGEAGKYRGLEGVYLSGLTDMSGERAAADRTASADFAQQQAGVSSNYRDAISSGLRRAKGLSRVLGSTDAGVNAQGLRDRVSMIRQGRQSEAVGLSGLASSSRIQSGLYDAQQQANQIVDSSKSNLYGSVAGGLLNVGLSGWSSLREKNAPVDPARYLAG